MLGSPIKDLISHKTMDELHRLSYCALVVFPSAFYRVFNFNLIQQKTPFLKRARSTCS